MSDPTPNEVVCIELVYSDGRIERAEGEDAAMIWGDIVDMYALRQVRGAIYDGPRMKVVQEGKDHTP